MNETLAVLVASHDRRESTLQALARLERAVQHAGIDATVYLVDDGSTDGTADAVQARFPSVQLTRHPGGLYWCRAMHLAWTRARPQRHAWTLWLNDDTLLDPEALVAPLALARQAVQAGRPSIVVGATRDAATGALTYGGLALLRPWHPTRTRRVPPTAEPQACDTMNGNFVLVPEAVADRLGLIDPRFEHAMGDLDYGLRARRAGIPVLLCPGFVGSCSRNPRRGSFEDRTLGLARRWRLMMAPKGLPWRSWLLLTRRHAGAWWPLLFAWPYLRLVASGLRGARAPAEQRGPAHG